MEEPIPAQTTPTQLSNPPTIAQCPPPKPPAPTPLPPKSKKRPLDTSIHIQNPNYFQMRVVIKELRPHFLEVLRTPDFRNCKAAEEIREQMKLLKELYKKITAETVSVSKSKNVAEGQPLSGENQDDQKPQEQPQDLKPTTEQPQQDKAFATPSENKFVSSVASEKRGEKRGADDVKIHGSYVIGGSAFGWNYITYLGDDPVYYGVTKESFRISNSSK
ncbi:hypothetical protein I3843_02G023700 [Carya illinoinensis]|uniref:Uncharacterized protein n=1 Tax=Carya illinoinensis TaxID=32201 RepID=A0A8T1R7W6_CARIL|nr:uncharacterized protein LOC122298708 [Carya illinoinensis]KAG2720323.1 hypothetical protein I3760_02G030600 [Carya illinoinensis]KAG6663490.1 hypothetical protein CIPAW_02G029900 [Carya illinoinensis]KAG7990402.1 hypothetical protein I3843_02G023700 [Carya illinoinensis]